MNTKTNKMEPYGLQDYYDGCVGLRVAGPILNPKAHALEPLEVANEGRPRQ